MQLGPFLQSRTGIAVTMGLMLIVVAGIVPSAQWFAPSQTPRVVERLEEGTVRRVLSEQVSRGPRDTIVVQRLEVELSNSLVVIEHARTALDAGIGQVQAGERVLVSRTDGPDGPVYLLVDYVRRGPLLVLALLFMAAVAFVGRGSGLWSLVGMALSLVVIVRFIVTGIVAGHDPVLITCVGALAIMLPTLYLAHGANAKTTVALAGTAVSLLLTAFLAVVFVRIAHLTGTSDEDASVLRSLLDGRIAAQGLLLAGIIVGALGVLDDVTVGQASTVFELRRANPRLSALELYRRAMNVGRDHIASTVNTLVLAYAGAALPLLILLSTSAQPLGILVSREFLATEIVRTLAGSIGIVAAVPATTILAAFVAVRK